jgi:hypothetical protein
MELEKRIRAFSKLSNELRAILSSNDPHEMLKLIEESHIYNPWFTAQNVRLAISSVAESMIEGNIRKWLNPYLKNINNRKESKVVGVVMAGNLPLVGFHDFLSVLISGNKILAKLSSDDNKILPLFVKMLIDIEPDFKDFIELTEDRLKGFDAIIATGSNNSARYFEYYFGKYPNIIRKNRNGVAIITGDESPEELRKLGLDVFAYFGMGCRSVSKLFVPKDYKFDMLFEAFEAYKTVTDHHKYNNNYEYYRSIYLVNQLAHFDNGFVMIKEQEGYASPPSVIYYENYSELKKVKDKIAFDKESIQCVVGREGVLENIIPFGKAQQPELWDYADGVDTMQFLIKR